MSESGNPSNARRKLINPVKGIFTGSFLVSESWSKNWPFILYLSLLGLIMISSSHSADSKVHRIAKLRAEMKELSSEYVDTRSRLMVESMEYKVMQKAGELGLKKSEQPPIVIETEQSTED